MVCCSKISSFFCCHSLPHSCPALLLPLLQVQCLLHPSKSGFVYENCRGFLGFLDIIIFIDLFKIYHNSRKLQMDYKEPKQWLLLANACAGSTHPGALWSWAAPWPHKGSQKCVLLVSRVRALGHLSQLSQSCLSFVRTGIDAALSAWGSSSPALLRGQTTSGWHDCCCQEQSFTSVHCWIMQMHWLVFLMKRFLVQYCIVLWKTIHIPTDSPGKRKPQRRLDKAE